MISEDKIAEIRDRAPIAEVIGNYVALKKSGNSLRGLIPAVMADGTVPAP